MSLMIAVNIKKYEIVGNTTIVFLDSMNHWEEGTKSPNFDKSNTWKLLSNKKILNIIYVNKDVPYNHWLVLEGKIDIKEDEMLVSSC